jgi:predicted ABC-type ATPase
VPDITIIAGPNGAGKTSFANEYLTSFGEDAVYVNADEIARELAEPPHGALLRERYAARLMLEQINALVAAQKNFVFETTLASLGYARKINAWRQQGFYVSLMYLRLAKVEDSLLRIQKRVAAGGHDIPEHVVRRRFQKSIDYFTRIYKPIVDQWYVWDSLNGYFRLAETGAAQ